MPPDTATPAAKGGPDMAGLVAAGFLLILAGLVGYDVSQLDLSSTYGLGPQAMPGLVAGGLVVLAIANVVVAFKEGPQERESVDLKAIFLILGGLAALIVCITVTFNFRFFGFRPFRITPTIIGFIPGTAILFAATATAFGRRAYLVDLAIGLVLSILVYLLFARLLSLSLPMGPIERLF